MCGRFVLTRPEADLVAFLDVEEHAAYRHRPSFNVAPTTEIAIVLDSAKTEPPTRRLESARWGLVAAGSRGPEGRPLINARAETVTTTPTFADAVARRRCAIPADAYYEWAGDGDDRAPHAVEPAGGGLLLFAGVYEFWRDPSAAATDPARWLVSAAILTAPATGALADLHDRVPVAMSREDAELWLDPDVDDVPALVAHVVAGTAAMPGATTVRRVGAAVGDVRNDGPELLDDAPPAP